MLRDWREDRRRSQLDLALDVGVSDPPPQLRRDRQVQAVARARARPRRAPRGARCASATRCSSPPATPRGTRRRRSTTRRWPRVRERAGRADPGPRPVPGGRRRPGLERRDGQPGRPGVARRRRRATSCEPPLNSYRITLHPDGMAPRIENFAEWAHHLLGHAGPPGRRDPGPAAAATCSPRCSAYPNVAELDAVVADARAPRRPSSCPLRLRVGDGDRPCAVVVLDEHVDRHARRHHPRRAARRAVPPRRRGHRGAGRGRG